MGKIVVLPRCEWCNETGAWRCRECRRWTCGNCYHGTYDISPTEAPGPLCIHTRYEEAEDDMDWVNKVFNSYTMTSLDILKNDEYRR